jgi:O-antigen/teichoic acid export membrane protein
MPDRLRNGTAYMVAGLGGSMIISFLSQVLASRALGPEVYGLFGLVLANSALIAGFVDPGLSAAMATLVAEKEAHGDRDGLLSTIKTGVVVETIITAVICGLMIAFINIIADYFFSGIKYLPFLFVGLVIVQGFYGVFAGVMQGFRELRDLSIIRFLQQVIFLLLTLLVVWNITRGLIPALIYQTLSILLALIASVIYTIKYLGRYPEGKKAETGTIINKFLKSRERMTRDVLGIAVPISLAAVTTSFITSSGPAILNFLTNNNPGTQLGILAVLLTLARTLDRVIKTIIRSAFPYLVRWNTVGSTQKTRQYAYQMVFFIGLGYLLIFMGAWFLGEPTILLIYGADYAEVARYLPMAILAYSMISVQDIFRVSLFSLKASSIFLIDNIIGVIVFFLCIFAGKVFLPNTTFIYLILFSMAVSNLIIAIGSLISFRYKIKQISKISATQPTTQSQKPI